MKSKAKKPAKKPSSRQRRSGALEVEETTRVVSQPVTVLRREPVTLSRALGERIVARPLTETQIIRTVRTRKRKAS